MSEDTYFVKASEATLDNVGAEDLFQLYVEEVARAFVDVDEGRRIGAKAKATITLTIEIKYRAEDGQVTFVPSAAAKLPSYVSAGARGHRTYDGKLKVTTQTPQPLLDFGERTHREDTDDRSH
ncbi:MAG: hypothetical protein ABIL09_10955 [Gemmatimonadota bacterium]